MKKILITIGLVILFIDLSYSQSFYNLGKSREFIATFGTGTTSYFGDLNDPRDYFDTRPNVNFGLQYFVHNRVAIRTEATWFQLLGEDEESSTDGRVRRNLSFIANNFEFNAVGIVQAFSNGRRFYQRPPYNFYLFAGLGLSYFNPKGKLDGKKYALQPLRTEGKDYNRVGVVIPFGGGLKLKMGPFFNIGFELGYRLTFTDYLDDVSTKYIDNSSFTDEIARRLADRRPEIGLSIQEAGSKRGEPKNKDGYLIYNLKLEYYLPPSFFGLNRSKYKRGLFRRPRSR